MHKNIIWQTFLVIVFACTLWYTVIAGYAYYQYSHLTAHTKPSSVDWEITELSEDSYTLTASYRFDFKGKSYPGTSTLTDISERNRWSAEQTVKEYAAKDWRVWFDHHNPNHSSLQKSFPLKKCLSAIFLWGLFLYFLWLGFYVKKFNP